MKLTVTVPDRDEVRGEAEAAGLDHEEYWQRIVDGLAEERATEMRRRLFVLAADTSLGRHRAEAEAALDRMVGTPPTDAATTEQPRKPRGYGMLAGTPGGSEEFAREKARERLREERFWRRATGE